MRRPRAPQSPATPRRAKKASAKFQAPTGDRGRPPRQASDDEMLERKQWVGQLMQSGASLRHMIRFGAERQPAYTEYQVRRSYEEHQRDLAEQRRADADKQQAVQADRLQNDLFLLRAERQQASAQRAPDGTIIRPADHGKLRWIYAAIARHEHELALILGTHAPLTVDIDVSIDVRARGALFRVAGEWTADQIDALANEQDELEQKVRVAHGEEVPS